MSTIPFFTTIPINMMPPRRLITFSVVRERKSAISTPLTAKGTENMMMKGYVSDSNCAAMTMKTSTMMSSAKTPRSEKESC